MTLRYLSICSGIEAASVAWHPLGWTAVGFAEIDKFASAVLAERYGSNMPGERLATNGVPNFGDFTRIDLAKLGPVDLLVGGTPCQAFSFAGKRQSLADARGNLTLAYAVLAHELARSHGLKNALWENVPGVLSTEDNAFGCFLGALIGADDAVPLPPGVERWPDAGMVAGPRARAAWRLLDAQYFGLAQRRERVFVVVDFGNGADPASVLFEPQGMSGHSPPRREAGKGFAADLAGSLTSSGRGVERPGESRGQDPVIAGRTGLPVQGVRGGERGDVVADVRMVRPRAFGGNNTAGEIEVAAALNAHGGPAGRQDFASETFIAHSFRTSGNCGAWDTGDKTDALTTSTDPNSHVITVPFDTTQITSKGNYSRPQDGDPCHPLAATSHPPAIAFSCKDHGADAATDLAPTLRAMGHAESHANAGGQVAVAFAIQAGALRENPDSGPDGVGVQSDIAYTLEARAEVQATAFAFQPRFARNDRGAPQEELAYPLTAEAGRTGKGDSAQCVAFQSSQSGVRIDDVHATLDSNNGSRRHNGVLQGWAVRRLTPVECARLQGFPDHHSRIAWRGKPAEECPDGPQYKTYGNSMATKVMFWIGERIGKSANIIHEKSTQ